MPQLLIYGQLFQHHCETAKLYNPLRKHINVLDALGVDGMSLDESSFDPHTSQPTYIIVKQSWQHPDLIGLEFLTNCITEIMSIAGLLTNMACSLTYMLALTRFIRQYTPHHVSVEFVGRQQPNGEMAQWGNMPQRGNMAQRGNSPKGKVWVHTRK